MEHQTKKYIGDSDDMETSPDIKEIMDIFDAK